MPPAEVTGNVRGVDVHINSGDFDRVPEALLERAVRRTLADRGLDEGEISVTLLSDTDIRALNQEYLSKSRPTDVLAFSLGGPERVLGDVYIGFEQAVLQSGELGVALDEELTRLAIHGTLHILGLDHPDGAARTESPMFEVQERLVNEVMGTA